MTDAHFTAIGSSQQPDEAIWQTIADKVDQLAAAWENAEDVEHCLLYTSPSPRDRTRSRMPASA